MGLIHVNLWNMNDTHWWCHKCNCESHKYTDGLRLYKHLSFFITGDETVQKQGNVARLRTEKVDSIDSKGCCFLYIEFTDIELHDGIRDCPLGWRKVPLGRTHLSYKLKPKAQFETGLIFCCQEINIFSCFCLM